MLDLSVSGMGTSFLSSALVLQSARRVLQIKPVLRECVCDDVVFVESKKYNYVRQANRIPRG